MTSKRRRRRYSVSSGERVLSASQLRRADPETKLDAMRTWFYGNYEDPVESCPYESAEGGYQYIWGGPYDPKDVLWEEFEGLVPGALIDQLAEELCDISPEWSAAPEEPDLADYEFDAITKDSPPIVSFAAAMKSAEALARADVEEQHTQPLLRMVWVSVVAAVESYLSDVFIQAVMRDPKLLRKFVETSPELRKAKIPEAHVFRASDGMPKRVRRLLLGTLWHRLNRVSKMYARTLEVRFPKDMAELYRAVEFRHDVVHRSGRDKEGEVRTITRGQVSELVAAAGKFVRHIERGMDRWAEF